MDDIKDNSITFNSLIKMGLDKAIPPIIVAGLTYLVLNLVNK
jgi:hypothetical protein